MAIETTGHIHKIMETQQISDRFTKREVILEVIDGKYPQFVSFQLTGDRCDMLDEFSAGEEVKITFNLRGREWTSPKGEVRYFNSLDIWKIELVGERKISDSAEEQPPVPDDDSIPF